MAKTLVLILLSAGFTAVSAWALGALLFRALKVRLYRQEERLFALLTGFSLLSLLVFGLAVAHLAYRGVFAAVAASLTLAALWMRLDKTEAPAQAPAPGRYRMLFAAAYMAYALLYVVHAMKPEISPDGAGYHLGHVARYLRAHGMAPTPHDMYGMLSQGAEMLFLFAFAYGRHSAAALVHCVFLFVLPLLMLAYARRRGFPQAGAAGAILAFAAPVTGVSGTAAYNDVAAAAVIFGCFYLLEIWDETQQNRLLIPAGLLAGFAFAIKYTAFLCLPYALGGVAWRLRKRPAELARAGALVSLAAGLMTAPWLVRNAVYYQNPLAPFFNAWFPNPYQDAGYEQVYRRVMRTYHEIRNPAELPRQVLYRGDVVQGLVGPVFVLAPLALLAARRREGRRLLAAGLVFALPYTQNIGARFLIPALPFVSLGMGLALARAPGLLAALVVLHAVLSWPAVVGKYARPHAYRLDGFPVRAALRIEPEEAFLGRAPSYRRARAIDRVVPPGAAVFTFSGIADSYANRDILTGYYSVETRTVWEMFSAAALEGSRPAWLADFRFPARSLARVRVVETASHETNVLGIAEIYLWRQNALLPREAQWRVTAWPNPWQASMALDNSAVTRWNSQLPLRPGFFFELRFGSPRIVDRVALLLQPLSHASRPRLEGDTGDGGWEVLAESAALIEWGEPLELRRMVNEEMRRRGVFYVLAQSGDAIYADLDAKRRWWGAEVVWEEDGAKLYRFTEARR